MVKTTIHSERTYNEDSFRPQVLYQNDQVKVICAFFEPDQFIPVHAPSSDLVVSPQRGRGLVRDGPDEHKVGPDDIVVIPAGDERGIKAIEGERLEVLLVVTPPPKEDAHEPVRRGIETNTFNPTENNPK